MKIEFNNCAKAIQWIIIHAHSEADFQSLREQLDLNHLYSGRYFVYAAAMAEA